MIFRRTSDVPALDDYEGYRPYLRHDFEHHCAYCLRHEFFFRAARRGRLTTTGRSTVRHVRLDRPTLVEFRRFLHDLQERVEAAEAGLRASDLPPDTRARLLAEMEAATFLLQPPAFSI